MGAEVQEGERERCGAHTGVRRLGHALGCDTRTRVCARAHSDGTRECARTRRVHAHAGRWGKQARTRLGPAQRDAANGPVGEALEAWRGGAACVAARGRWREGDERDERERERTKENRCGK